VFPPPRSPHTPWSFTMLKLIGFLFIIMTIGIIGGVSRYDD